MGRADNKFNISTILRTKLLQNKGVSDALGSNIFPCVAPENTDGDFVVYRRTEYSTEATKMGIEKQTAMVTFAVISSDYDTSQDIAEKIFNALVGWDGSTLTKLYNSVEFYQDSKYVQEITFEIT